MSGDQLQAADVGHVGLGVVPEVSQGHGASDRGSVDGGGGDTEGSRLQVAGDNGALPAVSEGVEPTELEAEFFPTPLGAILRMAEAIHIPAFGRFLDPCVGAGAIPDALPGRAWITVDIRDTGHAARVGSYLACHRELGRFSACVMNPPFSKALQFAHTALLHCDAVIMLQRLNWLATGERAEWMREHTPAVYVLPNRIDFTGGGGDSQEYAWFAWGLGHAQTTILGTTAASTRADQKPRFSERAKRQLEMFG